MELFLDPFTWRGSEVTFTGMPQTYPLMHAADPNFIKQAAGQQDTGLIVLGTGYNLNSPRFDSCGLSKDCDRVQSMTSMKSTSSLTIYNIESDGSRLNTRSFGRTVSPTTTTTSHTLSFNLQQAHNEDVNDHDHGGLFHDYQISSHMVNAQEDVPTLNGSSQVFGSRFQTPDEVEDVDMHNQPGCEGLPSLNAIEGSYTIKIGSCFNSMDMSLSADESSARAAIKMHALYPYLVSAHINCCQVGAKAPDLQVLEEARSKQHQQLHSRNNNSRSSPFTKPELDSIMAWYLGMLLDMKEKVEEPFFTEMEWCDGVLEKLKLLGPSASSDPFTGEGGEGSPGGCGTEGSAFKAGEARQEGYASSFDKRNGEIIEQWKQDKTVKDWLRSKHDRSEIHNLRGQCRKKRRQGKHPETARERLVEWFNGHGDWPYPSEEEKQKLAEQTNLEARQINNWFINQRKRHWDSPSKEEMIHHAQRDLDSNRQIVSLETLVKDRFYVPMDVFKPSLNGSCSWSSSLT
ncbi:unnamed protein product [Calypogeia fissa]